GRSSPRCSFAAPMPPRIRRRHATCVARRRRFWKIDSMTSAALANSTDKSSPLTRDTPVPPMPTLIRNIFTLLAFTILFVLVFNRIYQEINLGGLITTSAIFGVIIGLALQDTLGNFFAGISLHADRPFQVGDVIVVTSTKLTGVVESISWRAIKIRTFQNHIVLVSNSNAAKEAIEVCPRDNLNARVVFFATVYTDSPAQTIHVVREAVRDADNVSDKITPI